MDIVYKMPGHEHRLFINFIHACPNRCFFCVDFLGDSFYGYDLKNGKAPSSETIINILSNEETMLGIEEVYFCGIGEPLLRYDQVVNVAQFLTEIYPNVFKGINTSGLYFYARKDVSFSKHFDLIQISLNAENSEKYDLICRPKIKNAFNIVLNFMESLKQHIAAQKIDCYVEVSAVDTSEKEFLPQDKIKNFKEVPVPDPEGCKEIADSYGFDFKMKPLLQDSNETSWFSFAKREKELVCK